MPSFGLSGQHLKSGGRLNTSWRYFTDPILDFVDVKNMWRYNSSSVSSVSRYCSLFLHGNFQVRTEADVMEG